MVSAGLNLCLGQLGADKSEDNLGSALSGHGLAQACSLGEGRRKREREEKYARAIRLRSHTHTVISITFYWLE